MDLMDLIDAYNSLNLSPFCVSTREIRASFLKKSLLCHPDKGGDSLEFIKLTNDYNKLVKFHADYSDLLENLDTEKINLFLRTISLFIKN
jgi:curved DNA-binding protein CbpA